MSDAYPPPGGPPGGRPARPALLVGGGLAVLVLAAAGAAGGWLLAGDDQPVTTERVAAATPASPAARPTLSADTRSTPADRKTAPSGPTVPALIGLDFERAREKLRDRGLGWRLVFGSGTGRDVVRTYPKPGAEVRDGATVVLYVSGPAPSRTVPDLVGDDCADAAEELREEDFSPLYRASRRGVVLEQYPAAGARAFWNDRITITCGSPSATPTTSAGPSPTP